MKKKIMLGTSDARSTSHLSQEPSERSYHIVDCWIFVDFRIFEDCRISIHCAASLARSLSKCNTQESHETHFQILCSFLHDFTTQ